MAFSTAILGPCRVSFLDEKIGTAAARDEENMIKAQPLKLPSPSDEQWLTISRICISSAWLSVETLATRNLWYAVATGGVGMFIAYLARRKQARQLGPS